MQCLPTVRAGRLRHDAVPSEPTLVHLLLCSVCWQSALSHARFVGMACDDSVQDSMRNVPSCVFYGLLLTRALVSCTCS